MARVCKGWPSKWSPALRAPKQRTAPTASTPTALAAQEPLPSWQSTHRERMRMTGPEPQPNAEPHVAQFSRSTKLNKPSKVRVGSGELKEGASEVFVGVRDTATTEHAACASVFDMSRYVALGARTGCLLWNVPTASEVSQSPRDQSGDPCLRSLHVDMAPPAPRPNANGNARAPKPAALLTQGATAHVGLATRGRQRKTQERRG